MAYLGGSGGGGGSEVEGVLVAEVEADPPLKTAPATCTWSDPAGSEAAEAPETASKRILVKHTYRLQYVRL